jgi:hypothetical protein
MARLDFLKFSDVVRQLGQVRVYPDGIMGFGRGPGEGKADEICTRLNQLGDVFLGKGHAAGDKPDPGSLFPDEPDDFGQSGVEERLSPSLEDDGIYIPEVGEDFMEVLEAHILPRHAVVPFPAAHFASQGAACGQLDLPGGKRFLAPALQDAFPKALFHSFDSRPSGIAG